MTVPETMKAAVIREFGPPDVLHVEEVPVPEVPPGHVLVRVLACGLNHYDIFLRRGLIVRDLRFPHVMGADIVGEVAACAADVSGLSPGQRVIVAPGYPVRPEDWDVQPDNLADSYAVGGTYTWGGYAQYAVAPARFVLPAPPALSPEELATIPLVLVTAVHAVRTLGGVRRGDFVLVQAGASGSGGMCIQVARLLGARVATTVSSDAKADFARHLGAEFTINYRTDNFADRVLDLTGGRGADVVIDNVGAAVFADNLRALRRGGTFVTFGAIGGVQATIDILQLFFRQHHLHGSLMGSLAELREGLDWVAQGRIRPMLDRTFPLAQAADAHRWLEDRRVRGKVVLLPWA